MNFWEYLDRKAARSTNDRPRRFLGLTFRDWLGSFLVTAFIGTLFYLLRYQFPNKNEQLIVYMLGQLSGFVSAIVGLHYSASKHDEESTKNTGKAFEAIKATAEAKGTTTDDV